MPPMIAAPVRPAGQPAKDLHHEQEEQVIAPVFATWVSQDYAQAHDFAQEEDQENYPAEETEEYDYVDDDQYFGDKDHQW